MTRWTRQTAMGCWSSSSLLGVKREERDKREQRAKRDKRMKSEETEKREQQQQWRRRRRQRQRQRQRRLRRGSGSRNCSRPLLCTQTLACLVVFRHRSDHSARWPTVAGPCRWDVDGQPCVPQCRRLLSPGSWHVVHWRCPGGTGCCGTVGSSAEVVAPVCDDGRATALDL